MKYVLALLLLTLLAATTACDRRNNDPTTPTIPASNTAAPTSAESTAPPSETPTVPPPPAEITRGVSRGTLDHDNRTRTYRLYIPGGEVPNAGWPLIVGLHGGLGTGEQFASNSQFEAAAEREGFVAVFPDGVNRTWNGGKCCGRAVRDNVDDVGFLAALTRELQATLPLDPSRTFMTGHSNGGIMSFRFACERPELVRAIGPVAGSLEIDACPGSAPVDLLAIHGDSDQSHPLEGGEGPRSIAGVAFTSMADSMAMWSEGFACAEPSTTTTEGALTRTTWDGCTGGATATLLVIAGADHPWPGSEPPRIRLPNQGVPTDLLDATTTLIEYFATVP